MAELNVQPKKKSPIGWIVIIIIIVLIILYFIFRGSNSGNNRMNNTATDTTSMTNNKDTNHVTANDTNNNTNNAVAATSGWEGINYSAPTQNYSEITDKNIEVRNDNKYAVYSLGENILFDENKSTIRPSADKDLKEIAASIKKRFSNDDVRVYGFTDSLGSKDYNKNLAEDRAAAVESWLVKNGDISSNRISLNAVGEARPVATNKTEKGRQENRRVEIVVKEG
jgi:outer membrane protein OmpA-like peptidoglycan-associated protein